MLIVDILRSCLMVEGIIIGFSDMLSIPQTIGIVGTVVLTLFFSKGTYRVYQVQQTSGLNYLDEKIRKMMERAMEDQSIQRVIDREINISREDAHSFYILWICSHAYTMHKRNILDDNE